MNNDDRKYLAYLTAWAVNRINVQIYNMKPCPDLSIFPAPNRQILQEAESILSEWPAEGEKTSRTYTWKATPPKKEMTAKELVVKLDNHTFKYAGIDQSAFHEGLMAVRNFIKKEAGL